MNRTVTSLLLALGVAGCASNDPKPEPPMTLHGSGTTATLFLEVLGSGPLETGMTPVYVRVKNAAGAAVTDASVTFNPVMTMPSQGGKQHSAPVIGAPTHVGEGLYRCDVVFQMASMGSDTWAAVVGVTPSGGTEEVATITPIAVADSGRAKVFTHTDPDTLVQTRYIASLNFPSGPTVGLNPVAVTLHYMKDLMTFPPIDDATIALDPQMPSMGHGSPGSVAPTLTASSGVYEGLLSFSMAGPWETTITFTRGVVVGAPVFSTTF